MRRILWWAGKKKSGLCFRQKPPVAQSSLLFMAVGASVRRFLSGFVCQLIDNYTLFYFRFIRGNNRHDPQFWTSSYGRQRHRVWTGLAFERLCLNHIDELRRALGISGMLNTACAWHGKDARIDLLLDRFSNVVTLDALFQCD